MVYAIISEPHNRTGYHYTKDTDVQKAIFGKYYGTFLSKMFIVASYSENELADVVAEELGIAGDAYRQMFSMLCNVEICDGVTFTLQQFQENELDKMTTF